MALHGFAAIGPYGLGGYARQQAAEAGKSLPRDLLTGQPEWLALLPGIEAIGDAYVLRDAYSTRFGVVAAFEYPDGVDPSVYLLDFDLSMSVSLVGAGTYDDTEQAVAAWREQAGDSTGNLEPVTPEVIGWLWEAAHTEELENADELLLLGESFRGPRRLGDIIGKLGDRRAEPPASDPDLVAAEFITWYSARHDDVPDEDVAAALADEWLGTMLPGTQHLVSPRRAAAFRKEIAGTWLNEEEAEGALALLPQWVRWNGERAGMAPQLIDQAVSAAEG